MALLLRMARRSPPTRSRLRSSATGDIAGQQRHAAGRTRGRAENRRRRAERSRFQDRRRTGEIVAPDAPGRDPIVTRILWLRGRRAAKCATPTPALSTSTARPRSGTSDFRSSYGCIRMRSRDVIELFDIVGTGARGPIENQPLESLIPGHNGQWRIVSFPHTISPRARFVRLGATKCG